jgi:hypothetical protein
MTNHIWDIYQPIWEPEVGFFGSDDGTHESWPKSRDAKSRDFVDL